VSAESRDIPIHGFHRAAIVLLVVIIILSAGCGRRQPRDISPSFYYWKTTFAPSETEMASLRSLHVRSLYIRFFDIDRASPEAGPERLSLIGGSGDSIRGLDLIPVVFITNRTLTNTPPGEISELGNAIAASVADIAARRFTGCSFRQFQADCDWTEKTRDKYFALLKAISQSEKMKDVELSATIRLHPIKYREITGVPPVSRGVLMAYNTGDLNNPATSNSILEIEAAQKYVGRLASYPLALDVALPVYSWGVVRRLGKVVSLLPEAERSEFADTARFSVSGDDVLVVKSTYFHFTYLYDGDRLRLEHVSISDLKALAGMLSARLSNKRSSVIFYDLNPETIERYKNEDLQDLCDTFR
jgi:hypothetical protein